MTDVTSDYFSSFAVTAAAGAALKPDSVSAASVDVTFFRFVARLLSTADSVTLSYTVSVVTPLPAETILSELADSVEGGTFNALLHQYAADNGATALATATSESVTATEDTSGGGGGSGGGDDDGEIEAAAIGTIIGIAIGGFVALVLIGVGIYCACARGKSGAVAPV